MKSVTQESESGLRMRVSATLLVNRGNGPEEVRLADFLVDYADDAETFERVGALAVGQTFEVRRVAGSLVTVRRVS
jgi:hypothetical protein